jgi:4-diphosphocytidyl-2-C-methyl-D-erythritol kinase
MIEKKAYGKVNLGLDIIGRRSDGYHLVKMIMQSLDIYDTLTFEKQESGIDITLAGEGGRGLSLGEDNLIYKAAVCIIERTDYKGGIRITLDKNIPIAAGMAGGSSDCAAALKGVNELLGAGLSEEELREIGVTLGADVPYCVMGGTALSEGIGEELTRLTPLPECVFVVAKPLCSVSTAEAYGGYDKLVELGRDIPHPDIDAQVKALMSGDLEGVVSNFGNVLEYVTASIHPEIAELEKLMKESGAMNAMMSGSGPTVFGIYKDRVTAEESAEKIRKSGLAAQLFVTTAI